MLSIARPRCVLSPKVSTRRPVRCSMAAASSGNDGGKEVTVIVGADGKTLYSRALAPGNYTVSSWNRGHAAHDSEASNSAPRCSPFSLKECETTCFLVDGSELVCESLYAGEYEVLPENERSAAANKQKDGDGERFIKSMRDTRDRFAPF